MVSMATIETSQQIRLESCDPEVKRRLTDAIHYLMHYSLNCNDMQNSKEYIEIILKSAGQRWGLTREAGQEISVTYAHMNTEINTYYNSSRHRNTSCIG